MIQDADLNRLLQGEVAKLLGVTVNTIYTWERKSDWDEDLGPFPAAEREGTAKIYKWKPVLTWYLRFVAMTKYKDILQANAGAVNYEEWKAKKMMADAQMAQQDLEEAQGKLVSTAEAERKWASMAEQVKAKLLTVPSRCGALFHDGQSAAEREDALDTELRTVLTELAGLK